MIKLSIVPAQLPLLPDPVFSPGDQHLVGKIVLHASEPTTIGGLKLHWATTLRYRVVTSAKSKGVKWGPKRIMHCAEVVVLDREQLVPAGNNEFEFMLALPADLLDTRTTHYDQVEHVLSAGLLKVSPCYDRITHPNFLHPPPPIVCDTRSSSSRAMSIETTSRAISRAFRCWGRSARSGARPNSPSSSDEDQPAQGQGLADLPVLACCSLRIPVFRTCCSIESDPTWRFNHSGVIPGFGAIYRLGMYTPNLAIGGILDVTLSLEDIPGNATLHALDLSLVQETTAPERLPSTLGDVSPEPETTLDEYELWSLGQAWLTFPGRARPKVGSYLYRGRDALPLDKAGTCSSGVTRCTGDQSSASPTAPVHTPTNRRSGPTPPGSPRSDTASSPFLPASTTLHTRLHLPSPIIGALPTLEDTACGISTITHVLRLTFRYSILSQDWSGAPLPPDKHGQPVEGAVRSWSIEKQVILSSDTRNAGQTAPPGYRRCAPAGRPRIGIEPSEEGPLVPSANIARRSSYVPGGTTGRKWMRGVVVDEETLRRRTREHCEETEGLCECFNDGRERGVEAEPGVVGSGDGLDGAGAGGCTGSVKV